MNVTDQIAALLAEDKLRRRLRDARDDFSGQSRALGEEVIDRLDRPLPVTGNDLSRAFIKAVLLSDQKDDFDASFELFCSCVNHKLRERERVVPFQSRWCIRHQVG